MQTVYNFQGNIEPIMMMVVVVMVVVVTIMMTALLPLSLLFPNNKIQFQQISAEKGTSRIRHGNS